MSQVETPLQESLRLMRAKIAQIESCGLPGVQRMAMDLRHEMITLVSHINGMEVDLGAARMCGRAEPLKRQAPVDELPIFTQAAFVAPSSDDLERRMLQAHWREGDHTLDTEEGAE